MNKIVFISGTRADYGKIKPLMQKLEADDCFELHIYVTGMHLLKEYGETYKEILNDGYQNVFIENGISLCSQMDVNLANTILCFSRYIQDIKPDYIAVHGDRIDALAGAIVGMLNNIRVVHIEGGEVTGTVDDSIRHAITKISHVHFTANEESKARLIQLGENEEHIYIIGSPDIDIMLSDSLPTKEEVLGKYNIPEDYAIFMYHPVVTEVDQIEGYMEEIGKALEEDDRFYVFVYPNNDLGSDIIIKKIDEVCKNRPCYLTKSFPFEEFLTLLKNCQFMMGNSSAGIRESCIYGIPTINIGSRQNQRFNPLILKNIISVPEDAACIQQAISEYRNYRFKSNYFGDGDSAELFMKAMHKEIESNVAIQKVFIDDEETVGKISNFINEVCF